MRTFKHLFLILAATLALASCKQSKAVIDLEQAIPQDAIFVVSFNNKQMADKGELNKFKDFNLYALLRKEAANENEKIVKMFEEFLDDTRTSGLNLDRSFIYGVAGVDNYFNVVLLFKMDDKRKFENKLKEFIPIIDGGGTEPIVDKGNYKHMNINYKSNIIWNDDFLYIVLEDNYNWDDDEDTVNYNHNHLFAQNENNITTNADFLKFTKKGYDVGFWASYGKIIDKAGGLSGLTASYLNNMAVDLKDMYFHASVNFTNGEAKFSSLISPKSKMDEILKQYPIVKNNFDNDLLKYFPENSYMVMKFSINVQEYMRMMKDLLVKVAEAEEKIGNSRYYRYNPMDGLNEALDDPMVKKIVEGLEGDAVMSLYDFQQGMISMPMVGLIFNVKSQDVFDTLISFIPSEIVKKQDNHYAFMSGPLPVAYAACKDNKVYITTDNKAIQAFLDKGFDKNLSHSVHAKALENDIFYWNINTDMSSYPEHIIMLLRNAMGREFHILESFINIYKSVNYEVTDDYEFQFVIKMQNESHNSLKVILKNIDENVSKLLGR
ncbi:MAG: DUF4836 family protein [Prevotellaceae bacterium]|jgi:hypothetical protein|nr:DUF4836 family protein [Prevotellaceae bacterium]